MYSVEHLFNDPQSSPVMIIAEIGINHEGNLDYARELIDNAKECGADAVKFQVYRTEKFYNRSLMPEMYDIFKKFELFYSDFESLKDYADKKDILFFATPLDLDSLHFLIEMNPGVIKIASSDITTEPFLYLAAQSKQKVLLSTGFVDKNVINRAMSIFSHYGNGIKQMGLMYCVSKYPADYSDFDMNFIKYLSEQYHGITGFSDHSMDNTLSLAAVALGTKVIERHFTSDHNRTEADHQISLNPTKFTSLVDSIHNLELALGKGEKIITDFEKEVKSKSMRDIYTLRKINSDEIIKEKDIALMRPGNGIKLDKYLSLLDKKLGKEIEIHENI